MEMIRAPAPSSAGGEVRTNLRVGHKWKAVSWRHECHRYLNAREIEITLPPPRGRKD